MLTHYLFIFEKTIKKMIVAFIRLFLYILFAVKKMGKRALRNGKNLLNLQATAGEVSQGLFSLANICSDHNLDIQKKILNNARDKMLSPYFTIGVMGEFKRGKSSIINALIGKEVLPADSVPTSASLNYICYGEKPKATIQLKNGMEDEISIDELASYVTKLTKESAEKAKELKEATVFYPCSFCKNNVRLLDTPGLNDDEAMTEVSKNALHSVDAIIMVFSPDSPISSSEIAFIKDLLLSGEIGRIIFTINKIDNIRENDREKLISATRDRIQSLIADLCQESEEKKEQISRIISDIPLFAISAAEALEGKQKQDEDMIKNSNIAQLEKYLYSVISNERKTIKILTAADCLISAGLTLSKKIKDILKQIEKEKKNIIKKGERVAKIIDKSEFECRNEIILFKKIGDVFFEKESKKVNKFYDSIKYKLSLYIRSLNITYHDIDDSDAIEKTYKRLSRKIQDEIRNQYQNMYNSSLVDLYEIAETILSKEDFKQFKALDIFEYDPDVIDKIPAIQNVDPYSDQETVNNIWKGIVSIGLGALFNPAVGIVSAVGLLHKSDSDKDKKIEEIKQTLENKTGDVLHELYLNDNVEKLLGTISDTLDAISDVDAYQDIFEKLTRRREFVSSYVGNKTKQLDAKTDAFKDTLQKISSSIKSGKKNGKKFIGR